MNKKWLKLIKAELVRLIGDFKSYKLNFIFGNLNYYFLFIGLYYGMKMGDNHMEIVFNFLIGLTIWYYAVGAIQSVSIIIQNEARMGILEQLYMSKTNLVEIITSRLIAKFIFETMQVGAIFILCLITLRLTTTIFKLQINLLNLIVCIILVVSGLYGIGFIVAGLSIIYKKTQAVARAMTNFMLFFSGILIPLNNVPGLFKKISILLPLNWGIEAIREATVNANLLELISNNNFIILCLNSFIWIFVGVKLFKFFLSNALKRGNLSHY